MSLYVQIYFVLIIQLDIYNNIYISVADGVDHSSTIIYICMCGVDHSVTKSGLPNTTKNIWAFIYLVFILDPWLYHFFGWHMQGYPQNHLRTSMFDLFLSSLIPHYQMPFWLRTPLILQKFESLPCDLWRVTEWAYPVLASLFWWPFSL